jgi:hypothetical protein
MCVYLPEPRGNRTGGRYRVCAATGLSEEVARACLEYLRQTGKVERAGELYVPEAKAAGAKGDVGMAARRYRTRSPVAMPDGEMRFSRQGAANWSEQEKEAVYRALVAACRERGGPVMVGDVADKARGVGSMQKIGQILRALEEDNRAERSRSKEGGDVEVWEPK